MRLARATKLAGQDGFTLLELLVVVGILALAAAVVLPLARQSRPGLRPAAHELAAHLRSARAAAQTENVEKALVLDVGSRQYWADGVVAPRALPRAVGLDLRIPVTEQIGGSAGRIRFFPDGSASGGTIVLAGGGRTATVTTDWLNGDVRVEWRE